MSTDASARRPPIELYKLVVASLMLGLLVLTLSWLQGRFDGADHKKAVEIVRGYRPHDGGLGLEEAILRRHPGATSADLSYSSEIVSSCLSHVRVTIHLIAKAERPAAEYAFDVDLNGPSIHPTDPTTIEVLKSLDPGSA